MPIKKNNQKFSSIKKGQSLTIKKGKSTTIKATLKKNGAGVNGAIVGDDLKWIDTSTNKIVGTGDFIMVSPKVTTTYRVEANTETGNSKRGELTIKILDNIDEVMINWTVKGAFPIKFTPTDLNTEADSEVAVQEIELAIESWTQEYVG